MGRYLRALMMFVVLASCGGGDYSAPRDLNNACAILDQRPTYGRAFKATERRWGVPVAVQMATIYQESKFVGNARTPFHWTLGVIPMGRQSSAYGYAQALDATWAEYQRETGGWSRKRDDIADATDFMGWYMTKTQARNGVSLGDARNQYLAYHEGHTGFARQSYLSKSWLMRIAGEIENRALMYDAQLSSCPRRWR